MSIDVRNILLANDDLTVLGPPATLDVLVDIGPEGTRGSQFFVGVGNPNSINIGQTPLLNDLFLNVSPGAEVGYIYQYQAQPGSNTWVRVLNISPAIYSTNYQIPFVSGSGSATIPIVDIAEVTGTALTSENFSVQYSIVHSNPIASSMNVPPLTGAQDHLVIDFEAIEYESNTSSPTWYALDQEVVVHILVTVVETPEVS
jgi:hypothetical protein